MRLIKLLIGASAAVLLLAICSLAGTEDRIYGKITTVDGDTFQGFIRWDKNEGGWVDVLDGNKERTHKAKKSKRRMYRERESSVEIFGIKIGGSNCYISDWSDVSQSGVRFGHIRTLEAIGDDEVLLILKSGEEVEFESGSTDFGDGIREIVIEDRDEGELELVWDDIEMIEFSKSPADGDTNFGERLYGTLTTRRGEEFTGAVCWDVDELFTTDILDGEYKNRRRKIKFGKIDGIERYSSSGAVIRLKNGDELLLKGTNDVDDSNRGITISDPAFGQVVVEWDDFDEIVFKEGIKPVTYDQFDGGRRIKGTVYTEDGESYTGEIRWDNDEEFTWEILDGENRDVEFDIEFGLIKSIEKKSYRSALVTVSDGRTFRLSGSNDVDEDNKGIFIMTSDGEEIEVEWEDFERVEFTR